MIQNTSDDRSGNVKVVCRFRPMNAQEVAQGGYQIQEIFD